MTRAGLFTRWKPPCLSLGTRWWRRYIVPALGGQEPRLLVRASPHPRFSPDGQPRRVLDRHQRLALTLIQAAIARSSFQPAAALRGNSADSRALAIPCGLRTDSRCSSLVAGDPRPLASTYDWWRASLDGSAPIPVRANELLRGAGIAFDSGNIAPDDWRGNRVLLSDAYVSMVCAARYRHEHGIHRGPPDIWHQSRRPARRRHRDSSPSPALP